MDRIADHIGGGRRPPVVELQWNAMNVDQKLEFVHSQLEELKRLQAALQVTDNGDLVLRKNLTIAQGADISIR